MRGSVLVGCVTVSGHESVSSVWRKQITTTSEITHMNSTPHHKPTNNIKFQMVQHLTLVVFIA